MDGATPACPRHELSAVIGNGVRLSGRRQRYLCRPPSGKSHQFTLPVTEELVGSCLTCRREWPEGLPVAHNARFVVELAASFLVQLGLGMSMRDAAEWARLEKAELGETLATVTGRHGVAHSAEVSREGRLSADWLERYGAPLVRALMPTTWPAGTIAVDAKTFNVSARYPDDHPDRPGHPFPSGGVRFAVIAAAMRGPQGRSRICHVRAMPNDHKPSWTDFFRSLPGKPDTILSDPDPQIEYAIREAWPKDPPLHPLSTWHYWSKVQEKFLTARLYPWTNDLCRDSEAAFKHPELFHAWRAQAMLEAPQPVKVWLTKKGDEVQARLNGAAPPLAIGDPETFLGQKVAYALAVGRGKIRNLCRLDVRLGLIALAQNRQLRPARVEAILLDQLSRPGPRLVPRRGLDGAHYESAWLLRGWPD